MTVSKVAHLCCAAAFLVPSIAAAQVPVPPAATPATAGLTLSRSERVVLLALQASAGGYDRAAQDAALAAARPVVSGNHARYAFAVSQFEIGRARGDAQMQGQAVDIMLESGLAPVDQMPAMFANQANRAYLAGDNQRADRLLARLVELQPNNPVILADYGQFTAARITNASAANAAAYRAAAVALFERAFAANQAAGRTSPESWHQRAVALAFDGRMPQGIALARALVSHYPSPLNWRDSLAVYRQSVPPDPALDLDIRRLARAAQGLTGERDYVEFADALVGANQYGEVKAVLDEGISRGFLDANEGVVRQTMTANNRRLTADRAGLARSRTQALAAATGAAARTAGDAHFGYGQYAEAAELYRAALQKGSEDPNLVNSRLGAALALAGQRAEAEAAFRAVTGPRADLAAFWLAWLARRPA